VRPIEHNNPYQVREAFWETWLAYKDRVLLAADVPWPVEGRFLNACIDQNRRQRTWQGPFPLIERLEDELPVHNPLADARQSLRILREALGDRFFEATHVSE
jgi:hypothetical protein